MKTDKLNQIAGLCSKMAAFISFKRRRLHSDVKALLEELDFSFVDLEQRHASGGELLALKTRELELKRLEHLGLREVYDEVSSRFTLTASLLSARQIHNPGLEKFKALLYGEFLIFANEESSLAEEARAVLLMQDIERDLELVAAYSGILKKKIVAIGGGFSSGKSAFANSFFLSGKVRLPVGIEPVTAIPTYIVSSKVESITGFSRNGGSVALSAELYGKLSHEYVKSFGFSLREIMPYVAIGTPMETALFEHICLIDTPGYNPAADQGYTEEDSSVACEYLQHADALVWMLGLDANGTISRSDIDFLERLNLSNKRLFVVANKADLKPENELKEIVKNIQQTLEEFDIPYDGISAYSALLKKEYQVVKKSFVEFLIGENECIPRQKNLIDRLNNVFGMYEKAIKEDIRKVKSIGKKIHSLRLDLLPLSLAGESDSVHYDCESGSEPWVKRIDHLAKVMQNEKSKKHLSELRRLNNLMVGSVNEIFDEMEAPVP